MSIRPILCYLTLFAALSQGCQQPADQAEPGLHVADSLVNAWVEAGQIPGAVLLVSRDGEVVLHRAYGWAQLREYGDGQYRTPVEQADAARTAALGDSVPMAPNTVFDLASVTKVMATTLAIMTLVDDGTLELDATVGEYLPDFGDGARDQITLRHLLTHRSGLPQWLPIYYHAESPDEAYDFIRNQDLAWPVGEGRHYSDLGFMLLGLVVEHVTDESLDAFVQERLYGPLGLAATGYLTTATALAATSHGNPYEQRMVHDPDFGYSIEGDPDAWSGWRAYTLVGEVNDGNAYHAFDGVAGHAGLFSTATDLSALLRLLLDHGEYDRRQVFRSDVVDTFLTDTGDAQALGWQLPAYAPPGSFGHTGFTGTFVIGIPELDMGVVLLTNRQNLGVDSDTRYVDVAPLQRALVEALIAH